MSNQMLRQPNHLPSHTTQEVLHRRSAIPFHHITWHYFQGGGNWVKNSGGTLETGTLLIQTQVSTFLQWKRCRKTRGNSSQTFLETQGLIRNFSINIIIKCKSLLSEQLFSGMKCYQARFLKTTAINHLKHSLKGCISQHSQLSDALYHLCICHFVQKGSSEDRNTKI